MLQQQRTTHPTRAFSNKINHAFAYAALHSRHNRKGTRVPYFTHPAHVALLLARYDQDDDTICAALLHDVIEDCEEHTRIVHEAQIEDKFGPDVLRAVRAVTHTEEAPDGRELSSSEKKADYLARLADACDRARWVCAADKLHNARCILSDLARTRDSRTVWGRFNVSPSETVRWYRRVYDRLVEVGWKAPILAELLDAVLDLEKVPLPRFAGVHQPSATTAGAPRIQRPISQSYVVPGTTLVAGEYPGSDPRSTTRELSDAKLASFLDSGITAFIDLTGPADRLAPYEDRLREIAAARDANLHHERHTIPDLGTAGPAHMERILDSIDAHLAAGRGVYVHCWGGVGRTGMVVGCWLARHGRDGDEALRHLESLFRTMPKGHPSNGRSSPETEEQREVVRNWSAGRSPGNGKNRGGSTRSRKGR